MNNDDGVQGTPSTNEGDARDKTCTYCGVVIDTSDWYPVTKERDSEDTLRLYPFCGEDCQTEWQEEQSG